MQIAKICMVLMIIGLVAFWIGCSENDPVSGINRTSSTGVTQYFPLNENYSATYRVSYANGNVETVRYQVGAVEPFRNEMAVPWSIYGNDASYAKVHLKATSTALYYFENEFSQGEKILKTPLRVGTSWFIDEGETSDTVSIIATTEDTTEIDTTIIGLQLVTFPVVGSSLMSIVGQESLQLSTGLQFSGTLRVMSDNYGDTKSNYFWYSPGVGLVKWARGVTGLDFDNAEEIGEIVDYGF